jgi:hypothetical protein
MLAQGLKQFYARGLHFLAPRPAFLRAALLSSQQIQSSLISTQQVIITPLSSANHDNKHLNIEKLFEEV